MVRPYEERKLALDPELIAQGRELAEQIVGQVTPFILAHTTVSVERAVLRLFGIDGVSREGIPLANVVVDALQDAGVGADGAARALARIFLHYGKSPQEAAFSLERGEISLRQLPDLPEAEVAEAARRLALPAVETITAQRRERETRMARGAGKEPYLYVIVATGNIYEDVVQARAAARQGADIVAVIRSTGQSLLDYVPYGPTTEGFGGTFATQANFRIMRQALDEVGEELGRYIRLTNYASGLCMPEIAAMGALERLDVMLNDSMYGVIFRDINMQRTFIDQYFSRLIHGFAGIVINTGEDNYLTTADAMEAAHTVLASNFINEQFAFLAGLPEEQQGLGHAMEINPQGEDSFLYEIAQAELIREVFPRSPLKYMPPTKYMTGNIFRGQVQDALFNAASVMTGQSIHLLGMLTEAIHTPLLQDRALSLESARLVFQTMRHLGGEIEFKADGIIRQRASATLRKAVSMLEEINGMGLFTALEKGMFAEISRSRQGGRGLDGVIGKSPQYLNPFLELLQPEAIRHKRPGVDEAVKVSGSVGAESPAEEQDPTSMPNSAQVLDRAQLPGSVEAQPRGSAEARAEDLAETAGLAGAQILAEAEGPAGLRDSTEAQGSAEVQSSTEAWDSENPGGVPGLSRKVDLSSVRPYGDTLDDGMVQLSLTLPVPVGDEAREAARRWASQSGFRDPQVVHAETLGEGFTFFVLYARSDVSVDFSRIEVPKLSHQRWEKAEIDALIREKIGRKLVVVGACIESDAHTVGIDAIMNMKGYNGHKGLESYHGIEAHNLGAQVSCEDLLAQADAVGADAILISQVVTQKDIHVRNLTRMVEILELEGLRQRFLLICGGPRLNYELAKELGYDAGFGPGSYAEDVASFILDRMLRGQTGLS
ncbi:D-lysine 5,6-aminomutase alpha subunit [Peptococcaceae bacterium CEB3]|nr:D-lysine 5,6-aminomutase alpha subunit [Peptococcaceae bacterium CEB3]